MSLPSMEERYWASRSWTIILRIKLCSNKALKEWIEWNLWQRGYGCLCRISLGRNCIIEMSEEWWLITSSYILQCGMVQAIGLSINWENWKADMGCCSETTFRGKRYFWALLTKLSIKILKSATTLKKWYRTERKRGYAEKEAQRGENLHKEA